MTVDKVAEILKISEAEVKALLASGELKAAEQTPELLIDPASVMEHVASNLSKATLKLSPKKEEPVAVAVLVPLSLVLWLMFCLVMMFSVGDGKPMFAPPLFGVIAVAWIGATAALARWGGGLSTMNGMGVTLYGRKPSDRGPIATSYLVLIMLPLVPLRSFIVHEEAEHDPGFRSRQTSYRLEEIGLCWPQALPLSLGSWGLLAAGAAAWIYS